MIHEFSQNPETFGNNQEKRPLREVLSVRQYPEMAFQSYEMLKNNSGKLKEGFLAGEYRNPKLSYSEFGSPSELEEKIAQLEEAQNISREYTDTLGEEGLAAVESTLGFRANEMRLVGLFATLDEAVKQKTETGYIEEIARETRELNERLYGKPNLDTLNSSLGQLWSTIDGKNLSESAKEIRNELSSGFDWGGKRVDGLPKPEKYNRLPDFDDPSLAWAGEIILSETAPIEAVIREVWDKKVEEQDGNYKASPDDIVEMFEAALQLMDPDRSSGVSAEIDPGATSMSWDSSTMSIKVGEKRAAIASAEEVYKKFLHEGYIHGGRAINGIKTELSVLGTGLFTNTDRADYLTFEEGLATTIEEAVSSENPQWDSVKVGHCINIWLASQGNDFRSVFEIAWRYRLLDKIGDNQEVDDALIQKHKSAAYSACVRIFRGSPTGLAEDYPGVAPVTYNKDLAYQNGRIIAMEYLAGLYEKQDKDGLMKLMAAKYDPTVPEQAQLVDTFASPAIKSRERLGNE